MCKWFKKPHDSGHFVLMETLSIYTALTKLSVHLNNGWVVVNAKMTQIVHKLQ